MRGRPRRASMLAAIAFASLLAGMPAPVAAARGPGPDDGGASGSGSDSSGSRGPGSDDDGGRGAPGPGPTVRPEVRVPGRCGRGARADLRLRGRGDVIGIRFEVDHSRPGLRWQVALVHERRLVWRGAVRTIGPAGVLEVERVVPDLPGADEVTARAWGPKGIMCLAVASLTTD